MSQLLRGRRGFVASVSGPSSIGYSIAAECVEQGARVALACRPPRREQVAPLAEALEAPVCTLDAADEASVAAAVQRAAHELGGLDFVVHTLVSVPEGALGRPLLAASHAEFHAVMDGAVRSLLLLIRHCEPWLKNSGAPRVVSLLSPGADYAIANYHLVGIAKAALASTVRYLALELGQAGVACNAVSFSMIGTDAAQRVIGGAVTRQTVEYVTRHSMTRQALEPRDVAKTVAFLSSEECRNVTGQVVTVDGGYTASYF